MDRSCDEDRARQDLLHSPSLDRRGKQKPGLPKNTRHRTVKGSSRTSVTPGGLFRSWPRTDRGGVPLLLPTTSWWNRHEWVGDHGNWVELRSSLTAKDSDEAVDYNYNPPPQISVTISKDHLLQETLEGRRGGLIHHLAWRGLRKRIKKLAYCWNLLIEIWRNKK